MNTYATEDVECEEQFEEGEHELVPNIDGWSARERLVREHIFK